MYSIIAHATYDIEVLLNVASLKKMFSLHYHGHYVIDLDTPILDYFRLSWYTQNFYLLLLKHAACSQKL